MILLVNLSKNKIIQKHQTIELSNGLQILDEVISTVNQNILLRHSIILCQNRSQTSKDKIIK